MNRAERRALHKREAFVRQPSPGMRETWAAMHQLRDADIVMAVLPDETSVLVKGKALLEEIIRSGTPRPDTVTAFHRVPSADFAAALRRVLAEQPGRLN